MTWPQLRGVDGLISPIETWEIIRRQHDTLDTALATQEKQVSISFVLGHEALQAGGVAVEYTGKHEPKI